MNERKPGFYWVLSIWEPHWIIARWTGEFWIQTGYVNPFDEGEYAEIDESRLERDES